MKKIIYVVNKKLILTTIIAVTASTILTLPFPATQNQTASFDNFQSSSVSVINQLVDTPGKMKTSDREQENRELSSKKDNYRSNLESDSLVAVKPAKYIRKQEPKLEFSLLQAVTLVKELEGFSSSAYVDTDGTVVIGYGMPVIEGKKVKLGDRISQVKAELSLKDELRKIQQQVFSASTVELNSNQLVALTSFAFNVGVKPLFKSTLFRKLNAEDFFGAAREFPRWNKADMNGRLVALPGLTRRRLTEKNLFLTAVN